jgi:hypothetical protein
MDAARKYVLHEREQTRFIREGYSKPVLNKEKNMGNEKETFSLLRRNRLEFSDAVLRRVFDYEIGIFDRLQRAAISGIEVTQGIQYYQAHRHLTNEDDRGDDNSVRLVASKPAWARVYVHSNLLGLSQNVTGELVIERQNALPLSWSTVATLSPQAPGQVTTQSITSYAIERSTIESTLNFIIPQDVMWGVLRVTARIWEVGGNAASPADTHEIVLDVTLLQTLHLRGIMISYNGTDPTVNPANPPTINLPAPTVADLQATAAWTMTTNPIESQGIFSSAGTLQWGTPLTGVATNPGGCSIQWLNLNAAVAQVKANDGNRTDVIYYGLLPTGTPIQNVGGCESAGVSTGPNNAQVTMAHEIGHGAGLAHGPCGPPGDPNYPAYEPYDPANTPTASLGEYGLDINNGEIHPPAEKDYMSYCSPRWISLFHHARLINNSKFSPQTVGIGNWREPLWVDPFLWPWEYIPDPPIWERHPGDLRMKAEKLITIIGVINEEREVKVQSVMRVNALRTTGDAQETSFVAQLIGRDGGIAASAPIVQLVSHGHGCGCGPKGDDEYNARRPFAFQALVPDVEPGAALRIVRRGRDDEADKEVWVRRAPEQEPRISSFTVHIVKGSGVAAWEARGGGEQPLEFSLQFSKDGGRSWNGLAVGIRDNGHKFDLSNLPDGTVIFRLLAHDGFFTSQADSRPVKLPGRPPAVSILHPQKGPVLIAGHPMRLWAAVSTSTGQRIDPQACRWIIDGREVARGIDQWTTAPKGGEHRCTLIVEDGNRRTELSVTFTTIDRERINTSLGMRQVETPKARKASTKKGPKSKR